jgi:hypothetical protein
MSRQSLCRDARAARVSTTGAKNGLYVITIDELRVRLLEHIYGPNLGVIGGTAPEIDAGITRSLKTMKGDYGPDLHSGQWYIRKSNLVRAEAIKLSKIKNRDRELIANKLRDAKQYLIMANIAQNLHSIAVGIRDNKASEYREAFNGD